jgi:glycosyltransferase involved in cell wall biosynthesis
MRGQPPPSAPGRPLISVITVVKNGAASLERTLCSVLQQTYAPLEYIVCDGGSTDGTLELLRRYDDRLDYWRSEPDTGLYDAMNQAVRDTHGDWLLFLGADDLLLPGFSSAAAQCRAPDTLYYGDVLMPKRNLRYDGPFTPAKLARRNICQQALFYPRAVFAYYLFDTRYRILADWALNMHCQHDGRFRFQYVPEVIAEYNDAGGLSSLHADEAFLRDYLALVRANFSPAVYWWRRVLRAAAWPLRALGAVR